MFKVVLLRRQHNCERDWEEINDRREREKGRNGRRWGANENKMKKKAREITKKIERGEGRERCRGMRRESGEK